MAVLFTIAFAIFGSISFGDTCTGDLIPFVAAVNGQPRVGFEYAGEVVIPPQFENYNGNKTGAFCDGLALVKKNGRWGFIDKRGATVVEFQYETAKSFREGIAAVKTVGWTFIDRQGKNLCGGEPFYHVGPMTEGKTIIRVLDKEGRIRFGFADRSCALIGKPEYDEAGEFHVGIAPVRRGTGWFFLNERGSSIAESTPFEYRPEYHRALWEVRRGGLYGVYGEKGKLLLEVKYSGVRFVDGPAIAVRDPEARRYAFFDIPTEKFLTSFLFLDVRGFSEGLAAAKRDEETGENRNPWGFVDTTGDWQIPPRFHRVERDFENGRAKVWVVESPHAGKATLRTIDTNGAYVNP